MTLRDRAGDRIRLNYSWDRVIDQYEQFFERMISRLIALASWRSALPEKWSV